MDIREVVLPGEVVEERKGRKIGKGVYVEDDKIFSEVLGIPRIDEDEVSVIPLSGVYIPYVGDRVIGIVTEVELSGWAVDINSPYDAFLPLSDGVEDFVDVTRADLSKYFDTNDIIFCRISRVTKNKIVRISMRDLGSRKMHDGIIIKVTPSKIPRIIGKGGSMINQIKAKTGCDIVTGQNGVIWIKGEKKDKAIEIILKIENESHMIGLTERIEKMLSE